MPVAAYRLTQGAGVLALYVYVCVGRPTLSRKTIYLSEDDAAYLEAHRAEIGGSLSSAFMKGIRMVVAQKQLKDQGFDEIELDVGRPGAKRLKVFTGRLMARSRQPERGGHVIVSRRIYTTAKGAWVYFERSSVNWDYWTAGGSRDPEAAEQGMPSSMAPEEIDGHRVFEVRDSLDALTEVAPADLVRRARAESEDATPHVERLDI